jgi:23S rRNA (uracil1939-C5)-methyltransferase
MGDDDGLMIIGLGARGDGIAATAGGQRYLPFALPGERVAVKGGGMPHLLSAPSPERAAPRCRHFGVCGGCAAQHMQDGLYRTWKRATVLEAFRQRGLNPEVQPLRPVPLASRRRAVLTARRQAGGVVLGYHPRQSHDLFEVEECPVLRPELVAALPVFREIAAIVGAPELSLSVLSTPAGLDVALGVAMASGPSPIDAKRWARLAQAAVGWGIARLTLDGHTIAQRQPPLLPFAGVAVCPPAGHFVQAVAEAESAIAEEVMAATAGARRVADLFCGIGTLTFRLAQRGAVAAFDSDPKAIEALSAAARHAKATKPIAATVRDLFREPLSPAELAPFQAAVFDPPRAGAKAQAQALARSDVPSVVAVSCYPGTLARDVRILVDGGYRLQRVVPIDQFVYSAHVEAVAWLSR